MKAWTFDDIPDQTGREVIVTGANTGIGFETAQQPPPTLHTPARFRI